MARDIEIAWSDCKIAFRINNPDIIWDFFNKYPNSLPSGWEPIESDGAGTGYVFVFQVSTVPTMEDGKKILYLLRNIEEAPLET